MSTADTPKLLWDARHAAEKIARFVDGKTFADYLADDLLRSAVERQFTIMGEALAALRRADMETARTIPDLVRIIGFRNVLIHGYDAVDNWLVWATIETDLPVLRVTVEKLLENFPLP